MRHNINLCPYRFVLMTFMRERTPRIHICRRHVGFAIAQTSAHCGWRAANVAGRASKLPCFYAAAAAAAAVTAATAAAVAAATA